MSGLSPMPIPLLAVSGVTVRYHATTALELVDLDVRAGEVHAVIGENGAGKSTLVRAIAGAVKTAAGSIRLSEGARLDWVPQETLLPPDVRVREWIFLGRELCGRLGRLRDAAMQTAADRVLRKLACDGSGAARVGSLPLAQRKQVQLARALYGEPDLLLLDEPTAVLGQAEARALFEAVGELKQRGAGVLYVSHRLDEVLAIADRITVLRDGRRVSTDPAAAVDAPTLVQRMVGREVPARRRSGSALGAPALKLARVAAARLDGLTLTVRRGEVVGLAGLVGSGRSELLEAVAGLRPIRSGRIEWDAAPVLVPEDRGSKGLVSCLSLRGNLFLPADGCFINPRRERGEALQWIDRLRIRAGDGEAAIDALSGGNQQKLLLARALRRRPMLLLLDEPTAGVDVGAKAEIHAVIGQLAAAGAAILLASSDLPELLVLCDRIVALREGAVAEVVTARDANEGRLAALITGACLGGVDGRRRRVESE